MSESFITDTPVLSKEMTLEGADGLYLLKVIDLGRSGEGIVVVAEGITTRNHVRYTLIISELEVKPTVLDKERFIRADHLHPTLLPSSNHPPSFKPSSLLSAHTCKHYKTCIESHRPAVLDAPGPIGPLLEPEVLH